jgi:hypothetical protein
MHSNGPLPASQNEVRSDVIDAWERELLDNLVHLRRDIQANQVKTMRTHPIYKPVTAFGMGQDSIKNGTNFLG